MALEKKRYLRRVEFTFTDDEVHPQCHHEYVTVILEDGKEVARSNERDVVDSVESMRMCAAKKVRKMPEFTPDLPA